MWLSESWDENVPDEIILVVFVCHLLQVADPAKLKDHDDEK